MFLNLFTAVKMGCFFGKERAFTSFTHLVKEEAKRKSVYQYQIAHFKMIKCEKKRLPGSLILAQTKVKKLQNVKRIQELARMLASIPTNDSEVQALHKLNKADRSMRVALYNLNSEIEKLTLENKTLLESQKKLDKLIKVKESAEDKLLELELMFEKIMFNRRGSLKLFETAMRFKLKGRNREAIKRKINTRLVYCIRRVDRAEKATARNNRVLLEKLRKKKLTLESKIVSLTREKDELFILKYLDDIEPLLENSSNQVANDVNFLKQEYEKVIQLNDKLTDEIFQLSRSRTVDSM